MDRLAFELFVSESLNELIQKAESKVGRSLPHILAFCWLGGSQPVVDAIVPTIVERVFKDEDHISPCVDLAVADLLDENTLLIVGHVSGYAPRPFGVNWTGRPGPFVFLLGQPLLDRLAERPNAWSPNAGVFSYVNLDWPLQASTGEVTS